MRLFWKVFLALALMLPLGAFVAGSLVSSAADEPQERDTIVLEDTQAPTPAATPTPTPTGTPSSAPSSAPSTTPPTTAPPSSPATSADIPEASQTPDDFDDDNSGHGNGGDDDNSGHGGGDDKSGSGNSDDRDDDD